ncbi:hypothetical protein Tco_0403537 [Tanacetum coccineum]
MMKRVGRRRKHLQLGKRSDHLVDEEDEEPQPASEPQVEDDEYNLQRGIQMSMEYFQAPISGVAIREPVLGITRQLRVVEGKGKGIATDEQATQSLLDLQKLKKQNAETGADTKKSNSEGDTEILNVAEEQGEDVSNTVALEERTVELDEGQARSDPEPIFTATTTTTTTLPLPPPLPQQSTTVSELATRVSTIEKICANFKKRNKLQDKTTQAISSRVYMLENHDLYSKIDKYVNEVVKEALHNALQALIRERFRDLSEFKMKEILCDRMFKSGSYRSHPEHTTLYEALETFMGRCVVRFGKKGKSAPRFVGPFEIIKKVGLVAYRLDLPKELNGVHDTFHVSNLKKCLADPTLQVPLDEIQFDAKLNFVEKPVEILEREFMKIKRSRIAIVKVRWNSKRSPEFTWECED